METGSRVRGKSEAAYARPENGAMRCGRPHIVTTAMIERTDGPIILSLRGTSDWKPGNTAPPWNRNLAFSEFWREKPGSCRSLGDKGESGFFNGSGRVQGCRWAYCR